MAATIEATCLPSIARGARQRPLPTTLMDDLSARARRAYRDLVYETDGLRRVVPRRDADRARSRELNIGSRPASRTLVGPHRGPAGDPVGVQLEPVPAHASRLVRRGLGDRGVGRRRRRRRRPSCASCTTAGRSSVPSCRTWRWCWPRPTSTIAARYAALVPDRACGATCCSPASPPSTSGPCAWRWRSRGGSTLLDDNHGAGAQHRATASPTSTR